MTTAGIPDRTYLKFPTDELLLEYDRNPLVLANFAQGGKWRKEDYLRKREDGHLCFLNDLEHVLPLRTTGIKRFILLPNKLDKGRFEVAAFCYDEVPNYPDGDMIWTGDGEMRKRAERAIFEWNDQGTILLARVRYTFLFCQGCAVAASEEIYWIQDASWPCDTAHPPHGGNLQMNACLCEQIDMKAAREELSKRLSQGESPIPFTVRAGEPMQVRKISDSDISLIDFCQLRNKIQLRFSLDQLTGEARKRFRELFETELPMLLRNERNFILHSLLQGVRVQKQK